MHAVVFGCNRDGGVVDARRIKRFGRRYKLILSLIKQATLITSERVRSCLTRTSNRTLSLSPAMKLPTG